MYTSFFGLSEKPFAITPDPRYLYMSERHAEALAHLMYGVSEAGGFIQLTGEVGTGKTMIVRTMLERMPGHADVAVILNPRLTPVEFLLTICEELGVFVRDEDVGSIKDLVDILNKRLLAAHAKGRRVVVIVDEAQNLSPETLEQVRLLTNLETATQKLLQIILIGQPELRDLLERNELRQLAQRITGRYHLVPLSREETAAYVKHRLRVAGATSEIFTALGLREVHRVSQGVPRIINVICDRALLGAYTTEHHQIGGALVRKAAGEVYGRWISPAWLRTAVVSGSAVATLAVALGIWLLFRSNDATPSAVAATSAAPVAPTAIPQATTPVAPVQDKPPQPEFVGLLRDHTQETGTEQAFAALFAIWGGKLASDQGRPCDQALHQGFECVYQKGSWAQLRMLNRPAILTLMLDDGSQHQLVLTGLNDDDARVRLGDAVETVRVADISRYWFGDYLVLWKPQVAGQKALTLGMRGPEVRWLRKSLNSVQGRPAEPAGDLFDEELAHMVESFQREHHLNVDGIAGVQTQIVLDTIVNPPGAPLLLAASGGSA